MSRRITHITLLIDDYDKALKFYTEKLNFIIAEDTVLSETKRWVVIAPEVAASHSMGSYLLLAKAVDEEQKSRIGNQSGGRVFLFLTTDNFEEDYKKMIDKGVEFVREPVKNSWGTVAVFKDLYGNLWDLIEDSK